MSELDAYLDLEERESRRVGRGTLRRLAREILAQPGPFWGGLAMILLATAGALMEPRLFGYAIDEAIVPRDWGLLRRLSVFFFGAVLLRVGAGIAQAYLFELLGQRVGLELRTKLFSHLQRQPLSVYDRNPAGRLLTRVTNDVSSLNEMFSAGFVSMISNFLQVIGIIIWLVILNPELAWPTLAVFPVLAAASVYFSRRLRVAYRDARSRLSALNAFFAENLLGMRVVHLFNRQGRHLERFDRLNEWYMNAQIGSVRVFAYFQPSITWASGISMAVVIALGGAHALDGSLPVGVLVAYFAYVVSLFQPLREIADKWNIFLSGMASAERIFSILEWSPELPADGASRPAQRIRGLRGHIAFENVWFAYEGEHWVLRDFSLEIPAGTSLGVVGHTGAGKTTLISLLMRFYEPQRGRILIDGRDLREYDRRSLRSAIGLIQQDAFVFSGSLRDNLLFWPAGGAGSGDERARGILERIGLGDWWNEKGCRLEILERGSNVSQGERQILAFARALASEPSLWILDEATANMDSATERLLERALAELAGSQTRVLIAHRLATVRHADRIIVLHRGTLVESGSHEQLLAQEGFYARLHRYQESQRELLERSGVESRREISPSLPD